MAVSPVNGVGAVTKKLRGYDFFHAIGAPKRIVAPMVRLFLCLYTLSMRR
jgi:hypothetical protein